MELNELKYALKEEVWIKNIIVLFSLFFPGFFYIFFVRTDLFVLELPKLVLSCIMYSIFHYFFCWVSFICSSYYLNVKDRNKLIVKHSKLKSKINDLNQRSIDHENEKYVCEIQKLKDQFLQIDNEMKDINPTYTLIVYTAELVMITSIAGMGIYVFNVGKLCSISPSLCYFTIQLIILVIFISSSWIYRYFRKKSFKLL